MKILGIRYLGCVLVLGSAAIAGACSADGAGESGDTLGTTTTGGGMPTGGQASGGTSSGGVSTGGASTGGVATGGVATGGVTTGGVPTTGGLPATGGLPGTGGLPATGGVPETGGVPATGGQPETGGQPATGGQPETGGQQGTGGGTGDPGGENSIAYLGCSMANNIGNGYKRVGGKVMWNSDGYQTGGMVVQSWVENGSSWGLFDQKMASIGGKDNVTGIMVQICIFSSRATDAELRSMVAAARAHTNPGTHVYIVGQPQYESGHECTLAGNGGAQWTDQKAQELAADPSINENMTYLGKFMLDSTQGEVMADTCHATTSGEDELGRQAMEFFGG